MKIKYDVYERNLLCDAIVAKCEAGTADENDFDILAADTTLANMVDKKLWKRQGMSLTDIEGCDAALDLDKILNVDTTKLGWEK